MRVKSRGRTLLECAGAETFALSPDGLTLIAHWATSGSSKPERIELAEFADRVQIGSFSAARTGTGPPTSTRRNCGHAERAAR